MYGTGEHSGCSMPNFVFVVMEIVRSLGLGCVTSRRACLSVDLKTPILLLLVLL